MKYKMVNDLGIKQFLLAISQEYYTSKFREGKFRSIAIRNVVETDQDTQKGSSRIKKSSNRLNKFT